MKLVKSKLVAALVIGLFFSAGVLPQLTSITNVKAEDEIRSTVTILDEGFEEEGWSWDNPPTGWSTSTYFYFNSIYGYPYSGDQWAYSYSQTDSMVSLELDFQYETELTFWYAAETSGNPQSLEVYLDGQEEGTLIWSDNSFTHVTYQQATIDLSAYYGTYYIEFVNVGPTGLYGHLIDDVVVTTTIDTDPPVINSVTAEPPVQSINGFVTIGCTVTDNYGVDYARVNITYPDDTIESYLMDQSGTSYSFEQQYTIFGFYDFHIYAMDINGNGIESTTHQFKINNPPTADFQFVPTDPTTADTIEFTDLSTDPDGTIVSWSWDFGDGGSSTMQHSTYSYASSGVYTVSLTVTDDDGATDSTSNDISVANSPPIADFSYDPEYPTINTIIQFTDLSTDSDGNIVSWSWDFGDGNTSVLQDPTHNYSTPGEYIVSLTVTDNELALGTIEKVIAVAGPEILDVNQSEFDRGFRMMPGWAAYQEFVSSFPVLSTVELYMTKSGSPTGDVTVQIRKDDATGDLFYQGVISPTQVPSFPDYDWIPVPVGDVVLTPGETYVIMLLSPDEGAGTHHNLQWAWCDSYPANSGGPYLDGWFWFTKNFESTWGFVRDWDFTFRTYGY